MLKLTGLVQLMAFRSSQQRCIAKKLPASKENLSGTQDWSSLHTSYYKVYLKVVNNVNGEKSGI